MFFSISRSKDPKNEQKLQSILSEIFTNPAETELSALSRMAHDLTFQSRKISYLIQTYIIPGKT